MTGEITLTGEVLPIGGLKEKALAAPARSGVARVIAPRENERDADDVPEALQSRIAFTRDRPGRGGPRGRVRHRSRGDGAPAPGTRDELVRVRRRRTRPARPRPLRRTPDDSRGSTTSRRRTMALKTQIQEAAEEAGQEGPQAGGQGQEAGGGGRGGRSATCSRTGPARGPAAAGRGGRNAYARVAGNPGAPAGQEESTASCGTRPVRCWMPRRRCPSRARRRRRPRRRSGAGSSALLILGAGGAAAAIITVPSLRSKGRSTTYSSPRRSLHYSVGASAPAAASQNGTGAAATATAAGS